MNKSTSRPRADVPIRLLRSVLGWSAFALVGVAALLLMLVTPGEERRRAIGRRTSRIVLGAAGIHLRVKWSGNAAISADVGRNTLDQALPRNCVIVANHTGYLDGLILTAALPPRFIFVIKKEMSRMPLAGLLLRRLGSEFVDRFNRHRGAVDARRVLRRASEGQALIFFPEGTFSKQRGLLRFHLGAFVTAVRAGCPVVPVAIHGARAALAHDRLLVTPGTIELEILPALAPRQGDSHAATALRDEARQRMLARLEEPDLAHLSHVAPVLPADVVERM